MPVLPAGGRELAAEATTSPASDRVTTGIGVAATAASSSATASETLRSTSDSGMSSAWHSEASSSEEASFWPRSISEM